MNISDDELAFFCKMPIHYPGDLFLGSYFVPDISIPINLTLPTTTPAITTIHAIINIPFLKKKKINFDNNNTSYGAFSRIYGLYILTNSTDTNKINMTIIDGIIVLQIDKDYDIACHSHTMYGRDKSYIKSHKTIFRWWSTSHKFKCNDIRIEVSNHFKTTYLIRTVKLPDQMLSKITGKNLLASFNKLLYYMISCVTTESQREFFNNSGCGCRRRYNMAVAHLNLSLLDNML